VSERYQAVLLAAVNGRGQVEFGGLRMDVAIVGGVDRIVGARCRIARLPASGPPGRSQQLVDLGVVQLAMGVEERLVVRPGRRGHPGPHE
jgi:hypothetical protein